MKHILKDRECETAKPRPSDGGSFTDGDRNVSFGIRPTADDYAERGGYWEGPTPARSKLLKNVLALKLKGEDEHQPSLPFTQMPEFMAGLRSRQSSRAPKQIVKFLILTAAWKDGVL